ncbi:sulfite exporter TauE/SafE family protein [Altericroceibacterium endophyticum]|uniref:Probable membrane transporter protein n=1 Tax=Altericroceibacterium endophyticum TaxID=1808508 RepID=A0A6I4T7T7_9SPHN|nr:sulfite exporter TauE/SafE family protein [Altericroceibacterium endophyticum]MXO67026.1 TSUP family transporter [Altericroceibacterium endophyticum]
MEFGYSVAGAFVGFMVGLTGVGGGSLMAPLLIMLFGFSPAVAIGTDLWFAAITKSVGGIIHHRMGSADWQIIRRLALGSIPAALATLLWLGFVHSGKLDAGILLKLLSFALILTACIMPFKERLRLPLMRLKNASGARLRQRQIIVTIGGGAVIGGLVTLTSVGAGALVAMLLTLVYPVRMNAKRIVGTDLIHAIPLALIAAIGHSLLGNFDGMLLGALLLGSIPGIILGSLASKYVNEKWVRIALAAMLLISALKLLTS